MGLRIPTLKPIESTGKLPSPGRITVKAQDQAKNILGNVKALASLAKTGAQINEHFENEKINQLSDTVEKEYSDWQAQKLQELKVYKGDPTDAYVKYEEEEENKFKDILSSRPNINERVRTNVMSNLNNVRDSRRVKVINQQGYQEEVYKNNLYESTLKMKKNNLPDNAGYIKKGDTGSFLPFDQNISDMKTTIAKRGLENGTAQQLPDDAKSWDHFYKGSDGKLIKVSLDNNAKMRMASEISSGVKDSINAMISSGNVEQSELMLERYGNSLDPKSRTAINNKLGNEVKTNKAYDEVARISSLPENKRLGAIEKIKDEELKTKVLNIETANTRKRDFLRKRQQDNNNEMLVKSMERMKQTGQLNGIADLENDPVYKQTWDNLSSKQQKSIKQSFVAPKKSDQKAVNNMLDIFLGNSPIDIDQMTSGQFSEALEGLSKSDRDKYTNKFLVRKNKKNKIPTATYNVASKMLTSKLYAEELISKDKYGKLKKDDFVKLNKAKDDLNDYIDDFDDVTSRKELSEYVDKYIKQKKKEKLFGNEGWFNWGKDDEDSTTTTSKVVPLTPTSAPKKDPLQGLDNRAIFKLQVAYKRQFGKRVPPNDPSFLKFVTERQ